MALHSCVVIRCPDIVASQNFYEEIGLELCSVFPADAPREVSLTFEGRLNILLCKQETGDVEHAKGAELRIALEEGTPLRASVQAPEGTRISFFEKRATSLQVVPSDLVPSLSLAVSSGGTAEGDGNSKRSPSATTESGGDERFHAGRAGMLYSDLIPDRQGGRFVASRIRIPGPKVTVPDKVHFHDVRLQFLYCVRGSALLVYEDQGEPFVMQRGDLVLQPPQIRHRVLETYDDLEVIEVSSPAEHMTTIDREMKLPTAAVNTQRVYNGQKFLWHRAVPSEPCEDLGVHAASGGIASARLLRQGSVESGGLCAGLRVRNEGEDLLLWVVVDLEGSLTVRVEEENREGEVTKKQKAERTTGAMSLSSGDSVCVPPGYCLAVETLKLKAPQDRVEGGDGGSGSAVRILEVRVEPGGSLCPCHPP
uniref:Cupin type-2 domain-containing protein n=1 Tax=Chromera velia CCMP2878 TaxID=1169474 RepID=A0A0G4I9T7_9ALVE|eukprot:Cvel_12258.t1-p1 / transcript=Cvel_12258.t1 / gene=Cvel_12258 / organism=Chromera_velia_CCMP2878 / gene_product=hypothetical protein / transcript_product=hypothetical protein / location=Cvel_scaffold793:65940-67205(-) / protein_length=422 / sequence_SO=supercontig / SO=protein_coding / is_pseudo=false